MPFQFERDRIDRDLQAGRINKRQAAARRRAISKREAAEAEYHKKLSEWFKAARKLAAIRLDEGDIPISHHDDDGPMDAAHVLPTGPEGDPKPSIEIDFNIALTAEEIQNYINIQDIVNREEGD